jgi:hypothetical protein
VLTAGAFIHGVATGSIWVALGEFTAVLGFAGALIGFLNAREGRGASRRAESKATKVDLALPERPDLVNRNPELAEAGGKLRGGGRVLAIEGEVGVGKSAAATELAYRLQERDGRRRDQRRSFLWIDCDNQCPTLTQLCESLSTLTGDRALGAAARDEKFDAIRGHLVERPAVLLLDNLKLSDESKSKAMIKLLKAVPRSSMVIVSVNSPGILPTARVRLPDLELSEARNLVRQEVDRLGLNVPHLRDSDFVDRMLEQFGGNPHLITSFINGLDSSPHSAPGRLEAARRGDGAEAMLADHLAGLSAKARSVLAVCALLRGNAIASQLAVATEGSEEEVALVLAELMAAGLVTCIRVKDRPNMFTCGVGVRNVVLGSTPPAEVEASTERLARYFIERFSREWENATAAIPHVGAIAVVAEQLQAEREGDVLHDLFTAVLDILFTLGRFDERMAIATLAYKRAICDEKFQRAARASAARTMNCAIRGELAKAREAAALGKVAADQAGSPRELARQQRVRAYVAYRSRNPREALSLLNGADELAEEAGDRTILVDLQDLRAACYWYLGELDECEAAAREHRRLADSIPWERVKAYSPQMLAEASMHRGDFSEAAALLGQSRTIATKYEDQRMLVRIAISEARLHLLSGHPRAGVKIARSAIGHGRSIGLREEVREAQALRRALLLVTLPPMRLYYSRRRPQRLSKAAIAGD